VAAFGSVDGVIRKQHARVILLLALLLAVGICAAGPVLAADDLDGMTPDDLEAEKTREEIRELRSRQGPRGLISDFAPLGTLLIGLAGAAVAYGRFAHDRRTESIHRMDERFTHVATDLGSESEVVRSGAAVALRTFLKPRYRGELLDDVFDLVVTNVKIADHPKGVRRLLVDALEEGVKQRAAAGRTLRGISLARAWLERIDLDGLDLRGIDLAWARLRGANLRGCDLRETSAIEVDISKAVLSGANLHQVRWQRTHGRGAYFHEARMASIDLKNSDLAGAYFEDALVSGAHLQHADLTGANFNGATVKDTHFEGAVLDDAALRTLLRAVGWRDAYFDAETGALLKRMDQQRSRGQKNQGAPSVTS